MAVKQQKTGLENLVPGHFLEKTRFGVELEGITCCSPTKLAHFLTQEAGIETFVDANTTSCSQERWKITSDSSIGVPFDGMYSHELGTREDEVDLGRIQEHTPREDEVDAAPLWWERTPYQGERILEHTPWESEEEYEGNVPSSGAPEVVARESAQATTNYNAALKLSFGIEVVSPPLYGIEGLRQLAKVFEVLQSDTVSWQVTDRCGTHVHIETPTNNWHAIRLLACLMAILEYDLIQCLPPERSLCGYSYPQELVVLQGLLLNPWKIREAIPVETYLKTLYYQNLTPDTGCKYNEKRYRGLNLHSIWYRGTVEFRYFPAVKSITQLYAYIYFCAKVVRMCELPSVYAPALSEYLEGNGKVRDKISKYFINNSVWRYYFRQTTEVPMRSEYNLRSLNKFGPQELRRGTVELLRKTLWYELKGVMD